MWFAVALVLFSNFFIRRSSVLGRAKDILKGVGLLLFVLSLGYVALRTFSATFG